MATKNGKTFHILPLYTFEALICDLKYPQYSYFVQGHIPSLNQAVNISLIESKITEMS